MATAARTYPLAISASDRARRLVAVLAVVSTSGTAGAQVPPRSAAPPPPATDTDKEQARRLVVVGDERFAAGDYRGALEAYRGAELLMPVPTVGLLVARAQVALGQLLSARETLRRVAEQPVGVDAPPAFGAAHDEAVRLEQGIAARIPTLAVRLGGDAAHASVTVDGLGWPPERLGKPRELDPGEYEVAVWVDGVAVAKRRVRLAEGEHQTVELVVPPPAEQESAGVSPWAYVGFAFAGAGVVVGTITGAISLVRAGEVKDACFDDTFCPSAVEGTRDESVVLAHVSTASFAVAGAGAVVGIVALVVGPPDPPVKGARVELRFGAASAAIGGSF